MVRSRDARTDALIDITTPWTMDPPPHPLELCIPTAFGPLISLADRKEQYQAETHRANTTHNHGWDKYLQIQLTTAGSLKAEQVINFFLENPRRYVGVRV